MNEEMLAVFNENTEGLFGELGIIDIDTTGPIMFWNEKDGRDECSAIKLKINYEGKEYYINIYHGIGARSNDSEVSVVVTLEDIDFDRFPVIIYKAELDKENILPADLREKIDIILKGFIGDNEEEDGLYFNDADYIHGLASVMLETSTYVLELRIDKRNPDVEKVHELNLICDKLNKTITTKNTSLTISEFSELMDSADLIIVDNSPALDISEIKRDTQVLLKANWILDNSDYEIIIKTEDVEKITKVNNEYIINDIFIIKLIKIKYI